MGRAVVNNLEDSADSENQENQVQASHHLLGEVVDRLRACTQIEALDNWQSCDTDIPASQIDRLYSFPWGKPTINPKNHITWAKGSQVLWLRQKVIIPKSLPKSLDSYPLAGLSLRLALTWWAAAAQVFIDGKLIQEGDLFDAQARVLLQEIVTAGAEVEVMLRLVSPAHDQGALVRSTLIYELPYKSFQSTPELQLLDLSFIADQIAVYQQYLNPEELKKLANLTSQISWKLLSELEQFNLSINNWYQSLSQLGLPQIIQQKQINLLGHAHLDMAWLWEVAETYQVAQRTFTSVINLQKDFPELIFCHSTPALYQWIEQNCPELFAIIQAKVQQGTWELVGGMWIEPEMNLISGESIARQLLYGQRYYQDKFGQTTQVAWLPDTFGFCATLPQFLKLADINYFVTQKLDWNDTNKFPYPLFWWESVDGSRVLSLMSNPIGEGIEPVKIATYGANWEAKTGLKNHLWLMGVGDHGGGPSRDMLETVKRWQLNINSCINYPVNYSIKTLLSPELPPELLVSSTSTVAFPQLRFTRAVDYLEQIAEEVKSLNISPEISPEIFSPLPIWRDELYLEFHRGCYTTHADQKYYNRYCEGLLYEVELLASIATLSTGKIYPQELITKLWQQVLFNQFHDILPGTSIPEVFITANQEWQEVIHLGNELWEDSWQAIFRQINLSPPDSLNDHENYQTKIEHKLQPIIVFNSLNWQRTEVVSLKIPAQLLDVLAFNQSENQFEPQLENQSNQPLWSIVDNNNQSVSSQRSSSDPRYLLFLAEDIPSIGFRVFWLKFNSSQSRENPQSIQDNQDINQDTYQKINQELWLLENELLRVLVDPKIGDLAQVFDLVHDREVLQPKGGNQLQFWQDQGQYWDAWNIDPDYAQFPLPGADLVSIAYLERGKVRQSIRVVRKFRNSTFIQDYVLDIHSPLLKIVTTVDWQESHVLVKAAFPLTVTSDVATYEIPCGTIDRPTQPITVADKAKWEVPALRWADLSNQSNQSDQTNQTNQTNQNYGVSLLNNCKYGYDAQPDQLRLTLLRGSHWPDPHADRTQHQFTYALYPHQGNYQQARTIYKGYELNLPLKTSTEAISNLQASSMPNILNTEDTKSHSYFIDRHSWCSLDTENLIITALKQSETSTKEWIIRCYEIGSSTTYFALHNSLGLIPAHRVNLLEERRNEAISTNSPQLEIMPHQIASFCLKKPLEEVPP
jgi:alpha-mannosidase